MFQIDEDFLLVGTQNGKIEMWNIDAGKIVKYIDAHSESKAGISSIVELKDPSYLIRGERTEPNPEIRYIVTTCFDKNEFKIWKISPKGTHNRPEISFPSSSKIFFFSTTTTTSGTGGGGYSGAKATSSASKL